MKRVLLYLDDILIVAGFGLTIYATTRISVTAAVYVAGAVSILLGVMVALGGIAPQKGGRK